MTEKERRERISELLAELRELEKTPRSDWHAGFEALLRIEMHKYKDRVQIRTEEEIGIIPPRTDFVILIQDEQVEFEKAIFQMFRKINILEYKNPHDSLNERVIRKVCGYANLYIGTAEHEKERPSDEVTVSIFRAKKNQQLFRRMEEAGTLEKTAVPGIYRVNGLVDIPFQIIITDELEGEEYAAYRAMTDRASESDMRHVLLQVRQEKDETVIDHYQVLLNLMMEKNPQFNDSVREDAKMKDILMDIVKDLVDEKINAALEEERKKADAAVEEERKKADAAVEEERKKADAALEEERKKAEEERKKAEEERKKADAKQQETMVYSIRNIMNSFDVTLDRAMDTLQIPAAQRENYANLVMREESSFANPE